MDHVAKYIEQHKKWSIALMKLREAVQACEVEETIKWKAPVYTHNGKNILGLSAFKNYVGLWFFQGATLKDTDNVLMNAQEGKTSAMRQWRFTSVEEIDVTLIRNYVKEAINNQVSGNIISPQKNTKPLKIHELLQKELDTNTVFAKQFESFSLSKKREFANYIMEAKRAVTQEKRLKKIVPLVEGGVGLYDQYKNC